MADDSSNNRAANGLIARLGKLLMALVAGEDLRVRQAIARAATRARPDHGLNLKTRLRARHDLAANPRVE